MYTVFSSFFANNYNCFEVLCGAEQKSRLKILQHSVAEILIDITEKVANTTCDATDDAEVGQKY